MSLIGAHSISSARGYSVHRQSGLLTVAGSLLFGAAILLTRGALIATPGWAPLLDWTNGYVIVGGALFLAGILGVAGLAFDDGDEHCFPRLLTLASAFIGVMWWGIATVAFCAAYARGYTNAGMFLAVPGAILNANRLYLLSEWPSGAAPWRRLRRMVRRRRG